MLIHSAVITGSVQFNNTDVSGITNVSSFATTASVDAVIIKTGSFATTSSVNELQSKTGSYTSTSSFGAYSSSINTFTSSATTRLNTIESVTGSFASTSSVNNLQSVTGSYASTGSNQFNGNQSISGSITSNGTITAQTLVVQTVTSSIEFVTGSTRNGSIAGNTHQFTGSVLMSGSLTVGGVTTLGGNTLLSYSSNTTTANAFPRLGVSNTNATQQDYNVSELYVSAGNGAVNGSLLASYSSTFPTSTPSITLRNTGNGPLYFSTNGTIRQTIAGDGAATFSSTVTATGLNINGGTVGVSQASAARIVELGGNSNNQGSALNYRIVRHYPVVSSGNKLIIPFVDQGNLNSTTIVRIFGHGARFNSNGPLGFTADFGLGHLNQLLNLAVYNSTGNISSITVAGMNIEIAFTSAYTAATANGVFVTIDYMTNVPSYSINVANITMN